MLASEAQPFSKTGGLADVIGSLPRALSRLGHRVTVVTPRYRGTPADRQPFHRWRLRLGERDYKVGLVEPDSLPGVRTILLECPELYDREGLYGIDDEDYPDNAQRFALLASAAVELASSAAEHFDVLHGHDWQAGLAPVYLRTHDTHGILTPATVFTIHNLAYQGLFPAGVLSMLGVGPELFTVDGIEYWGKISFLKAGINFSDAVTTVSPRYAKEILTPEFGFGFDSILSRRREVLTGILNGIDVDRWNPATDRFLPEPYSAERLEPKIASKRALLARFRLPADSEALQRPLVGMISRLIDQKGFDLLAAASSELMKLDATFVLLGTGQPQYEALCRRLSADHPHRFAAHIGFDEELAHLIEGGADLFLMPSRFEPCGLNQMYSLRYGTVPIVRAVGGLADTVKPYSRRSRRGNGFTFRDYSPAALLGALRDALALFDHKDEWRALQLAGMRADHSWDVSARAYVKVYRGVLRGRDGAARPSTPGSTGHRAFNAGTMEK